MKSVLILLSSLVLGGANASEPTIDACIEDPTPGNPVPPSVAAFFLPTGPGPGATHVKVVFSDGTFDLLKADVHSPVYKTILAKALAENAQVICSQPGTRGYRAYRVR